MNSFGDIAKLKQIMKWFCGIWKNKVHPLIIILNSMIYTSHAFEFSEI